MNSLRVGIYNRWLATLGGGEKHSLSIAEYLSQKYQVQVISHKPVSKDLAAKRLSLDLSRVEFVFIPDRNPVDIGVITSDYDLFINSSFMDFFPCFAKYSACLIYFPAATNIKKIWGRQLKLFLRRWLKLPAIMVGVQNFQIDGSTFKWSTDTICKIRLPPNPSPYVFKFELCSLDENVHEARLVLDSQLVSKVALPHGGVSVPCEVHVPGRPGSGYSELTLSADGDLNPDGHLKMEISNLEMSLPQYQLLYKLIERWFFGVAVRLQYYPPGVSLLDYIDTYSQIWVNSQFSRKWIKTYWRRNSELLYPPLDVQDYRVEEKRPQILSVGRFFAGQHNKKHLILVEAFKHIVDQGLHGWELHLAGGSTPGDEHAEYLRNVYHAATGYPIFIHTDIPFADLIRLYAQSAIYWHASGYGEDERRDPVKFEHFGITTVEAMASGCVPVVIGKGGQPEIVRHGVNGYLWNTLEEMEELTRKLTHAPDLRQKMSAASLAESKKFDKVHFRSRLDSLLENIGITNCSD